MTMILSMPEIPLKDASKFINSSSLSPDGKRVAFDARGDVWTVPAKTGITKNLTHTSGMHERNVNWSPDGQYIAYVSDKTGEDEIYIQKQDGSADPVQITKNADTYKYAMSWSPDSKKLLWADKLLRLQYVDIDSKDVTLVDQAKTGNSVNMTGRPTVNGSPMPVLTEPRHQRFISMNLLRKINTR